MSDDLTCVIVHIDGDVDTATAGNTQREGVTHCDSSGLAALIAIHRAIHADHGGLVLARPPAYAHEILKRPIRETQASRLLRGCPAAPLKPPAGREHSSVRRSARSVIP